MVSFTEALNYVVYKNPVSQFTITTASQLVRASVSMTINDANLIFTRKPFQI